MCIFRGFYEVRTSQLKAQCKNSKFLEYLAANTINENSDQITVDRLSKLKSTSEIYIITRKDLYEHIVKNIKNINPENVIIEPSAKNTAPAIGLVSEKIYTKNKNAIMGIFPADHLIVGHKNFEKSMDDAFSLVKTKDHLVTIGIKPTYPSTAYGYIQYEPDNKNKVGYHVKTFAEKPHEKLAKT